MVGVSVEIICFFIPFLLQSACILIISFFSGHNIIMHKGPSIKYVMLLRPFLDLLPPLSDFYTLTLDVAMYITAVATLRRLPHPFERDVLYGL